MAGQAILQNEAGTRQGMHLCSLYHCEVFLIEEAGARNIGSIYSAKIIGSELFGVDTKMEEAKYSNKSEEGVAKGRYPSPH